MLNRLVSYKQHVNGFGFCFLYMVWYSFFIGVLSPFTFNVTTDFIDGLKMTILLSIFYFSHLFCPLFPLSHFLLD